jgi:colanic acid/amylovoran biosynthesis glycosyltransferase
MPETRKTVAHFVTPYLFQTGSWIHTQLTHARRTRPVVITHRLDHPERFPFEPVHLVTAGLNRWQRLALRLRYYRGQYSPTLCQPVFEREQPALIHAHMGWEGVRALPVAQRRGLPLVTSFYGRDAGYMPQRYPWWRTWYRTLFQEGTLFMVEGPHLGRTLEGLGCPPHKIRVVHLGIDISRIRFRPRRLEPGHPIQILVSSSLRPKKGVRAAVRVFDKLAKGYPNAHLRILGDGPQRRLIEDSIRRRHLSQRVTLEGYVPYEGHLEALQQAHLFLAASRTAPDGDSEGGAPVALIEAQAAGLPIISTHHADIPEVVEDTVSGLLSPEFDDDALARNLEWLLEHPETWARMGQAGRARMEREFDARRQAERAEMIYCSCGI